MEREITLAEVLAARESRAARQRQLLAERGLPLISFCMNIAGPVKNGPLIRRAYREGLLRLEQALRGAGNRVACLEERNAATGCEALLCVEGEGAALKKLCIALEDEDALGRLFDLDVLLPSGEKLEREALGCPPRPCLVCGKPGKGCASRRVHSAQELRRTTDGILQAAFRAKDGERLADQAARALLYEAAAGPKPGLVDRYNSGSHRDMDLFTFLDSTAALLPYLRRAAALGMETAPLPPEEVFPRLRREGLRAEAAMFRTTAGVNTHKGAVFTLGTVCCAAGRLWKPERPWAGPEAVLAESGRLYAAAAEADFARLRRKGADTAGGRLYLDRGLEGIRGELARGLPSALSLGLPALRRALAAGGTLEQAGCAALLRLISAVTDTNLLHRGGQEGLAWAAGEADALCAAGPLPDRAGLEALDAAMTAKGLSPGGCADLLAICYFLYFCERSFDETD